MQPDQTSLLPREVAKEICLLHSTRRNKLPYQVAKKICSLFCSRPVAGTSWSRSSTREASSSSASQTHCREEKDIEMILDQASPNITAVQFFKNIFAYIHASLLDKCPKVHPCNISEL